ncbi:hypothetical protein K8R47_02725 [archaeon]|nr:hypothetical protein [archaeon]
MKGLIVAYGENDSRGRDRLSEIRGLMKFGGKEVVVRTLEKMKEIGIEDTLIVTNESSNESYQRLFVNSPFSPRIENYPGSNPDMTYVYTWGLSILGFQEPILAIADDHLFDFSLESLVKRFGELDKSILAVRRLENIGNGVDLNFGKCVVDENGKILEGSYSFFRSEKEIDSDLICMDLWLVHQEMISDLLNLIGKKAQPEEIISYYLRNIYSFEINEGFWADIGKPELRKQAEIYFNN